MKSTLGIIFLVAGAGLLVWGYREAQTFKGRLHQTFSGSTNNRITWMYVGGAVLVTAGAGLVYASRGKGG
ncbi:MAG TPA: DUF3185 family protein [Verrucomicrobiota bacterium]|nr:DUF3185 family protein [Verrucomicrobiota bacterium]HNT16030.1 DUF3185 family protein [Verrucomicrobiota bacterium]